MKKKSQGASVDKFIIEFLEKIYEKPDELMKKTETDSKALLNDTIEMAINCKDETGKNILSELLNTLKTKEHDETFLSAVLNKKGEKNAAHAAIRHANTDILPHLKKLGVDLNHPDECGQTPLHHALLARNPILEDDQSPLEDTQRCIDQLIELGANVDAEDNKFHRPIHFADDPELIITLFLANAHCDHDLSLSMNKRWKKEVKKETWGQKGKPVFFRFISDPALFHTDQEITELIELLIKIQSIKESIPKADMETFNAALQSNRTCAQLITSTRGLIKSHPKGTSGELCPRVEELERLTYAKDHTNDHQDPK